MAQCHTHRHLASISRGGRRRPRFFGCRLAHAPHFSLEGFEFSPAHIAGGPAQNARRPLRQWLSQTRSKGGIRVCLAKNKHHQCRQRTHAILPEGSSIVLSVVSFKPFSYLHFRLLCSFGFTESAAVCGRLEWRIFVASAAMSGYNVGL